MRTIKSSLARRRPKACQYFHQVPAPKVEQIDTMIRELDGNEQLCDVIQNLGNYLVETFEATGEDDDSLMNATKALMDAWNHLQNRIGR